MYGMFSTSHPVQIHPPIRTSPAEAGLVSSVFVYTPQG